MHPPFSFQLYSPNNRKWTWPDVWTLNNSLILSSPPSSLSFYYSWFHGKLMRDRKDAEVLLAHYKHVQGAFLVRENATFSGNYLLSFMWVELLWRLFYWSRKLTHNVSFPSSYDFLLLFTFSNCMHVWLKNS